MRNTMDETRNPNPGEKRVQTKRRVGLLEVVVAAVTYLVIQIAGGAILALTLGTKAIISQNPTATVWLVGIAALSALVAAFVANVVRIRSLLAIGLVVTLRVTGVRQPAH